MLVPLPDERQHNKTAFPYATCSGAFRINRLMAITAGGKDVTNCNGPPFTAADVPQDLLPELECGLMSAVFQH